jgi:hypothetical protein
MENTSDYFPRKSCSGKDGYKGFIGEVRGMYESIKNKKINKVLILSKG